MSTIYTAEDHALVTDVRLSDHLLMPGELHVPQGARGLVLFAHGSGGGRHSPHNYVVAREVQRAGIATLLFDLLSPMEQEIDLRTEKLRFNVNLLAARLVEATRWVEAAGEWIRNSITVEHLRVGYFGASTGAAAAIVAAASLGEEVGAIVSRGGRPDMADKALERVKSPTLLIVGGRDVAVLGLNRTAYTRLGCEKALKIVSHASHLFEEPGAIEEVAALTADWFGRHLLPRASDNVE